MLRSSEFICGIWVKIAIMRHKLCPFCSIQKDLCSIQTFQFLFRKHFVNKYRVRTFNIWLIIIFRIWEALKFKLIPNLNFIEWIKISPRKKRSEIIEWSRIPPQRDILKKSLLFTPQKHQLRTGGDKLGQFTLMYQKILMYMLFLQSICMSSICCCNR